MVNLIHIWECSHWTMTITFSCFALNNKYSIHFSGVLCSFLAKPSCFSSSPSSLLSDGSQYWRSWSFGSTRWCRTCLKPLWATIWPSSTFLSTSTQCCLAILWELPRTYCSSWSLWLWSSLSAWTCSSCKKIYVTTRASKSRSSYVPSARRQRPTFNCARAWTSLRWHIVSTMGWTSSWICWRLDCCCTSGWTWFWRGDPKRMSLFTWWMPR